MELRVFRLYLFQHSLATTSHDDFIAEFGELERERQADSGGAPGDENGAIFEIHRNPFICMLDRIMYIIQRSHKKISEAVQKMIPHTRQELLPIGRLGKYASDRHGTRH